MRNNGSKIYHYYQDGHKWVQFEMFDLGYGCSISGDTIVIIRYHLEAGRAYDLQLNKYNEDLDGVIPIQDSIGFMEEISLQWF